MPITLMYFFLSGFAVGMGIGTLVTLSLRA
jgi:hypothetical protein